MNRKERRAYEKTLRAQGLSKFEAKEKSNQLIGVNSMATAKIKLDSGETFTVPLENVESFDDPDLIDKVNQALENSDLNIQIKGE